MTLSAIVFLLDDQLAFRFAKALHFALQLVEAIHHFSLDSAKIFLQVLDQRIHISFGLNVVPGFALGLDFSVDHLRG